MAAAAAAAKGECVLILGKTVEWRILVRHGANGYGPGRPFGGAAEELTTQNGQKSKHHKRIAKRHKQKTANG